jgi:hypothetical protein
MGLLPSTTLAHFGINACLLTRLPLLIFGKISEHTPFKPLSLSPAHCVFSPGSCRVNLNPMVFRVSFGFIFAREELKTAPVIAPRVTFLRERFWANGFELDQTVENPEPFLAPLPSCGRFPQKLSCYRDLARVFQVNFSDPLCGCKVRFGSVCICQNAYHFSRPVLQNPFRPSSLVPQPPLSNP